MRIRNQLMIFIFITSCLLSPIEYGVALQEWQGIGAQFFFPEDIVYTSEDMVTLTWDWFEEYYNGNGTINNLSIYYVTRFNNQKQLYLSEETPRELKDVPNSILIDLASLQTERTDQIILFIFYMSLYLSISEQDVLVDGYTKVMWTPKVIPYSPEIPWYIYVIVAAFSSIGILYYVYWSYYSCDNEENFNRVVCKQQKEQQEKKEKIQQQKQQTSQEVGKFFEK